MSNFVTIRSAVLDLLWKDGAIFWCNCVVAEVIFFFHCAIHLVYRKILRLKCWVSLLKATNFVRLVIEHGTSEIKRKAFEMPSKYKIKHSRNGFWSDRSDKVLTENIDFFKIVYWSICPFILLSTYQFCFQYSVCRFAVITLTRLQAPLFLREKIHRSWDEILRWFRNYVSARCNRTLSSLESLMFLCKIWGSRGGEDVVYDIIGSDALRSS